MEGMERLRTIFALPTTIALLILLMPPYLVFKLFRFIRNSLFSENVAGKVILITGASSGIGEHLAYAYAKRGARLVLSARRESRLREVEAKARKLGSPDVLVVSADVSKIDDCQRLIDETINHFGQVDHLVNNAGVVSVKLFKEYTDTTYVRSLMDINFWGSVYTTKFAVPYLQKSKGKIIAIASAASFSPPPAEAFYSASKAAVVAFFETLRVELAPDIKITIVAPGFIESEMTQGKHVTDVGMKVDERLPKVLKKAFLPVSSVEGSVESILQSVCRGDRYLIEPPWMYSSYFINLLYPEVIELYFHIFFLRSYRKLM